MATTMIIYFMYKGGVNIIAPFFLKKKIIRNDSLLSTHAGCANYSSLTVILERVMEKSDEIVRIKYHETLYEQMNEAELAWSDTKDLLKENYSDLLETRNISEESKVFAIKCYGLIIDSIEIEVLGLVRRWMRKNHFVEKNTMEYQAYIDDKVNRLQHKSSGLIDRRYEEKKMIVPRKELKESNLNVCFPIIQKRTNLFFLRAKEIAEEKTKLILELKKEIQNV